MPFTAGVHCFKRVVTDTEPKTTSSEQFIDLIDNPAGGPRRRPSRTVGAHLPLPPFAHGLGPKRSGSIAPREGVPCP